MRGSSFFADAAFVLGAALVIVATATMVQAGMKDCAASDQLLLSQSLQIGYEARQPPMLAWLHALAVMAGGISQPVIFGLKYLLLFIGLAFYYLAARNVLIRPGVKMLFDQPGASLPN